MNTGKTVFSQLLEHFPSYEFTKCVQRYNGEYKVKSFSCLNQFLAMAFAQLTLRESLRDIETCMRAMQSKLYHSGFRGTVSRNTLANANSQRDWRIYADFALVLIDIARDYMRTKTSAYNSKKWYMQWIQRPSIYASHFSLGQNSANTKPPSKCTHFWIFMETFRHLSGSPTGKSPMSLLWIYS